MSTTTAKAKAAAATISTTDTTTMPHLPPQSQPRPQSPKGKLILLEGNIGVGKSTLATSIAARLGARLFLEPTTTNPFLEKFYAEPERYALRLQTWIYRMRFRLYVEALRHIQQTGQSVVLDRSVFSDEVFAVVNHEIEGNISRAGFDHYNQLRRTSLAGMPKPDVVVLLRADAGVCEERIKIRSRNCECGIPSSYLEALGSEYERWAAKMSRDGVEVVVLDWGAFPRTPKEEESVFHTISAAAGRCHEWSPAQWLDQKAGDLDSLLLTAAESSESRLEQVPSEPETPAANRTLEEVEVAEKSFNVEEASKKKRLRPHETPTSLEEPKLKKALVFDDDEAVPVMAST